MHDDANGPVREIWWIRHGETEWNASGRIQGSSDVPLSDAGRAQARALGERLRDVRFDAVHASDLERAHETATLALPDVEPVADRRLRELAYGLLEGASWSRLTPEQAEAARVWREDPARLRLPPGDADAESYNDLTERVQEFVRSLPASGRFAAFAHGGTIRSALYATLGDPAGAWRVAIDNTSVTRVRTDARGVTIVTLNDHAHLSAVRAPAT